MEKEQHLRAEVFSELDKDVSFGFGCTFRDESMPLNEMIDTLMQSEVFDESFWENHYVFEDGLERAIEMYLDADNNMTREDALCEVFGHFKVRFELNGDPIDIKDDYDVTDTMYQIL